MACQARALKNIGDWTDFEVPNGERASDRGVVRNFSDLVEVTTNDKNSNGDGADNFIVDNNDFFAGNNGDYGGDYDKENSNNDSSNDAGTSEVDELYSQNLETLTATVESESRETRSPFG